jgi:hypothetical protein
MPVCICLHVCALLNILLLLLIIIGRVARRQTGAAATRLSRLGDLRPIDAIAKGLAGN